LEYRYRVFEINDRRKVRMIDIGFIGYGSMGRMLVKGLIKYSKVEESRIIITRRDKSRLTEITREWSNIRITEEIAEVVTKSKYIFLCIKPADYLDILKEMQPFITKEHHIISITSALMMEDLERILDCRVTKLMPTVISEVGEGISLICHNHKVGYEEQRWMEQLLSSFTKLTQVEDENFGFASEFTSCGPGFYAALLKEFVEAGTRYSGNIPKDTLQHMVLQTVYGTVRYLLEQEKDFEYIIGRVATKGGITEEGVKVMENGLPNVFDEVFQETMEKRKVVDEKMQQRFLEI
jgi:pyrroline-5-carboxylate reductase